MRPHRPSATTIIAVLALVFAVGGTAIAASRYVITSTSQIKPSVLRELQDPKLARAAAIPKGPKAVIDRARASGVTLDGEAPISLSGPTWTQVAGQANGIFGQVNVTLPPAEQCSGGSVDVLVDGGPTYGVAHFVGRAGEATTQTYTFEWEPPGVNFGGSATWLVEPSTATSHTLTATGGACSAEHSATINWLAIDVLGFR